VGRMRRRRASLTVERGRIVPLSCSAEDFSPMTELFSAQNRAPAVCSMRGAASSPSARAASSIHAIQDSSRGSVRVYARPLVCCCQKRLNRSGESLRLFRAPVPLGGSGIGGLDQSQPLFHFRSHGSRDSGHRAKPGLEGAHAVLRWLSRGHKVHPALRLSEALDLDTLVCTRGPNFPLSRLETRLMCPACGSRRVTVVFEPPTDRQVRSG
jgi:hypothetical protein